jgi:hypothetical protein
LKQVNKNIESEEFDMPDPIKGFAQVAYALNKAADYVKQSTTALGHQISNVLGQKTVPVEKKIQDQTPKMETQAPTRKVRFAVSEPTKETLENQTVKKTMTAFQSFFSQIKQHFESSYELIKTKDELKQEVTQILNENQSKPFNELTAHEQGIIKLYISSADKSILDTLRTLADEKNPKTLDLLLSLPPEYQSKFFAKLSPDTGVKMRDFLIQQTKSSRQDDVFQLLNSTPLPFYKSVLNSLLTPNYTEKMTNPTTSQRDLVSHTIRDSIINLCHADTESLVKNQNLLLNVPANHLTSMLKEVWEENPEAALHTVQVLSSRIDESPETAKGISQFVQNLNEKQQNTLFEMTLEHPPRGISQILLALPSSVSVSMAEMMINSGALSDNDLADIASHLITNEVKTLDSLQTFLVKDNVAMKFVSMLQRKENEKSLNYIWGHIPNNFELTHSNLETKEIIVPNPENFLNIHQTILKDITHHLETNPPTPAMKKVYQHLQNEIDRKFPSANHENGKIAVLGLYLIKMQNAMLVNPQQFDDSFVLIDKQAPNAIEIAKILTKFALGEKFEASSNYAFMNPFFEDTTQLRNQMFQGLTQ